MYAQELMSASLPLLLRTPNGRIPDAEVGQNRDTWILNPGARSPLHLEMLKFIGKLMGVAIRSNECLPLNLPPIIWYVLKHVYSVLYLFEVLHFYVINDCNTMTPIFCVGNYWLTKYPRKKISRALIVVLFRPFVVSGILM